MKSRDVAVYGIYMAIFLIIGLVPKIGLIRIGIISFTTMALPVTVITVHRGWQGALFGLTMFGITSSIALLYLPEGAILIANLGVLKSMITLFFARILIFAPLGCYLLLIKDKKINGYLSGLIIALIISISNTLFVFAFFTFFGWKTFWGWFVLLGVTNILPEWLIIPAVGSTFGKLGMELRKRDIKEVSW